MTKNTRLWFPVSRGIFEHCKRIGSAVWLFEWYIDKTTGEVPTKDRKWLGVVLRGRPVRDAEAAADLGVKHDTVARWRNRLMQQRYIRAVRAECGYIITVWNSQRTIRTFRQQDTHNSGSDTQNSGLDTQKVRKQRIRYRNTEDTKSITPSDLQPITKTEERETAAGVFERLAVECPEAKGAMEKLGVL